MEYAVQVEVTPAADTAKLDALQCHGVAALLTDDLTASSGCMGPMASESS
ncbi:hypothetical protein ACI2LC_41300 [Nonomuraea wenchangensis]